MMSTLAVTPLISSIGVQNPTLRVFDIIMETEYGTSYNAYLARGTEKTALVEAVHAAFFDEYLENIRSLADVRQIDYLILNHTEPDHSGCVAKLLEINPDITVVATGPGHKYLAAIVNRPYRALTAAAGQSIDLGGLTLSFIPAPLLHWPDSMFTWCPEEKALFSCDFLGAHYSEPRVLDSKMTYPDKYLSAFRYYYDCIFAPFKPFVLQGLQKAEALGAAFVCPSHGPVLSETIGNAMALYRAWSSPPPAREKKKVLIAYVSAYGCTRTLAKAMAAALEAESLETESVDLLNADFAALKEKIDGADGLLLGTPTINRDALKPVWDATTLIDAIANKGKPAGVFGSYGWSGEGVPMITERLRSLKLGVLGDGFKANFVPSPEELDAAAAYAREFAAMLK